MNFLRPAVGELVSLFVDDGSLALFAVLLIAVTTALIKLAHLPELWGGALLFLGCIAILFESVMRAARKG